MYEFSSQITHIRLQISVFISPFSSFVPVLLTTVVAVIMAAINCRA